VAAQAVEGLPEGRWISPDSPATLPPKEELGTSIAALIGHFGLICPGE
jgi:NADH-quinone oxidoreductase subunit D